MMNWRYLDPRGGEAEIVAAFASSGQLAAFVVTKRSGRTGQIVDLVCDPAHPPAATALLDAATVKLRGDGCAQVICWLPPAHPLERSLEAAGFLDTGQKRTVMFETTWMTPGSEAVAVVNDPGSRLHVMMGDFDFV